MLNRSIATVIVNRATSNNTLLMHPTQKEDLQKYLVGIQIGFQLVVNKELSLKIES